MGDAASPLTVEDFAGRCSALEIGDRFAIAVSGGRDSMALARLAASYAGKTGAKVTAFTVDHGLRPESAEEAMQAGRWCEALGLSHRILLWDGDKPASGKQEAARQARYRLLIAAMENAGLDTLLTAHSADDQAETVFMRLTRGAGPRGLSAMDDLSLIAAGPGVPVRLARPLLSFSRARLTATVKSFDQEYVDDPGNDDPAFERIRVRALLAALEQQDLLTQSALLRTAKRMRAASRQIHELRGRLLAHVSGCFYRWGGISCDEAALADLNGDDAALLVSQLLHAVSGEEHAPDEASSSAALSAALETSAATLNGALIKRRDDRIWFLREPAAITGRAGVAPLEPLVIAPGERSLWDRRFIIENSGPAAVEIRPLGQEAEALIAEHSPLFNGPREGLAAIPGLFRREELIAAPGLLSGNSASVNARSLAEERFGGQIIRFS